MTISRGFIIASLVLFILAGLGVNVIPNMIAWGLASFAAGHL